MNLLKDVERTLRGKATQYPLKDLGTFRIDAQCPHCCYFVTAVKISVDQWPTLFVSWIHCDGTKCRKIWRWEYLREALKDLLKS
jgi:hypothetical protein